MEERHVNYFHQDISETKRHKIWFSARSFDYLWPKSEIPMTMTVAMPMPKKILRWMLNDNVDVTAFIMYPSCRGCQIQFAKVEMTSTWHDMTWSWSNSSKRDGNAQQQKRIASISQLLPLQSFEYFEAHGLWWMNAVKHCPHHASLATPSICSFIRILFRIWMWNELQ